MTPSAGKPPALVAIQLQDASGHPARARAPINVTLTPSNSTIFSRELSVVVNVGRDYALIPFSPLVPGTTTFTVYAPGLSTTSLTLTFLPDPVSETITGGPQSLTTEQTAVISATVLVDGQGAVGTPVIWNSTEGGLSVATQHLSSSSNSSSSTVSSSTRTATSTQAVSGSRLVNDTTDKGGSSVVIFHPDGYVGTVNITAVIAPPGFAAKSLNFTVQVTAPPPPVTAKQASITQRLTSFPLVLAPIGGAAGVVAAVFLVRRRRGGLDEGEEGFDESLE